MKPLGMFLFFLLASTACAAVGHTNALAVVRHVADMHAAFAARGDAEEVPFDFVVKVTLPGIPGKHAFVAEDATGAYWFGTNPEISDLCPTNAGDVIRVQGAAIPSKRSGYNFDCRQIELVRREKPVDARPMSGKEVYAATDQEGRLLRVTGTVCDTFRDEIDPPWSFIVMDCDGEIVYCAIFEEGLSATTLDELIGARVSVDGILRTNPAGNRVMMDRLVYTHGMSYVKVLSAPSADPFSVPELPTAVLPRPTAAMHNAGRLRASGYVVASWADGLRMLLKTDDGRILRTELRSRPAPRYGERVEVSGLPETDLYRVNLSRAAWRKEQGGRFESEPPLDVHVSQLVSQDMGVKFKNAELHGRAVRLHGTVRGLPAVGRERGRMYLEEDSELISIDSSACPEALANVEVGCLVEVSGTFVNDTENWRPNRVLPQIREVLVAIRKPGDVRVLARPPWWTPVRLVTLIGALLAVLLGIFAWNVALRRRAERRGRELADEQLAHITSELKVVERTRLAVELHDSLSQTLTGISMGIDSAIDIAGDASEELKKQLAYTSKTVEACRTELRNCLWDLRSQALEESDMNAAIQLALSQIVSKTALNVRFVVPRTRLSDKTAHTILRIIRELATNAVRHGHASSIKIAGSIDGGKLRFSVTDNGSGFDPKRAPGVAEGHFGLEGIQERVDRLDGEVDISSSPGRGTRVTVAFDIPSAKMKEGHGNG